MASHLQTLSVLILAGGQSSRMGEDKALIEVDHQPLLQRVCHVAITLSSAIYILTPWPERYQAIVPTDCHFLPESQPNQGPLVALANGLATPKNRLGIAISLRFTFFRWDCSTTVDEAVNSSPSIHLSRCS
jgi:molybdopterin-guanine dinucleotide biosynthesis protein A